MLHGLKSLFRLPAFRNAYLLRGAVVWLGLRLAMTVGVLLTFGNIHDPSLPEEMVILMVVSLIVFLDARRRAEDVFLGNLGMSATVIALGSLPLATVLEVFVP